MENTGVFSVIVLKAKDQHPWKILFFYLEHNFGSWVRGNKYCLDIIVVRI